jgi:hypothetical protein
MNSPPAITDSITASFYEINRLKNSAGN